MNIEAILKSKGVLTRREKEALIQHRDTLRGLIEEGANKGFPMPVSYFETKRRLINKINRRLK